MSIGGGNVGGTRLSFRDRWGSGDLGGDEWGHDCELVGVEGMRGGTHITNMNLEYKNNNWNVYLHAIFHNINIK